MLKKIDLSPRSIEGYRSIIDDGLFDEVHALAKRLKGKKVLHINSAPSLGGVAEILVSLMPLLNSLGLEAEWRSLPDIPRGFYRVTKAIHNGLHGSPQGLSQKGWKIYEDFNRQIATELDSQNWDFIFVHDPQLAAILSFLPKAGKAKWLWRSHTYSAEPNTQYQKRLIKYLQPYDGALFTMGEYVFKGLRLKHLMISPPAIDALSPKNLPIKKSQALGIVSEFGIDPRRPLITQISRFNPWKDMPGAAKAWKLAKAQAPDIQLAIVGNFSAYDPQASDILAEVRGVVRGLPDAHIIVNQAGPRAIKAFQTASNIILQKSTREGFGLTVSEALWSKTPVIGGNVGGIPLQVIDNKNGYLVDSIEECAKDIVELIQNPSKARAMGEAGHQHVRAHFLLPRLIRDELKFMLEITP